MTGKEIYDSITAQVDESGSPEDTYASDLIVFHSHSCANGDQDLFYALVLQAHNEGKKITVIPNPDILEEEYPVSSLGLV